MGSFCQESPLLMPVLPVLPEPSVLAEVGLALELALASSLLPAALPLLTLVSPCLALLALVWGTLRKTMSVPLSGRSRLASMPTAAKTGSTSFIRFQSHREDLGHALSRQTPSFSATGSSS